ncbi:MAG: glycosyltransferase [Burkholderiaceae bacterium]|nr:glycosyltransferase [Burkholderiaceae bacterium]
MYYSTPDTYPPFRVDVAELFGHCLPGMGLEVEWYMARNKPGVFGSEMYANQKVFVPWRVEGRTLPGKVASKFAYWICDIAVLLGLLFERSHKLIQVRDKYISALVGLLVAKIKGIKFTYWCSYPFPEHDLELAKHKSGLAKAYYRLRGRTGQWLLYRFVMRHCDHIFVQSEEMKRELVNFGVAPQRMTPVPMGVPTRLVEWSRGRRTEVVPNRIVYLGTMSSVRQLHVLLDAFAKVRQACPEASLLMVGDGDYPSERAGLEAHAQQLGLAEAITFTGFVPIETAWNYAATAAVCVSPICPGKLLDVGSPTKLIEYMALGRPVVCNSHPEQSAIIAECPAGLCVEWSASAFAEALLWMLHHPQEAETMGAKGPAWVASNRTYPILASQLWQRYQSILGGSI